MYVFYHLQFLSSQKAHQANGDSWPANPFLLDSNGGGGGGIVLATRTTGAPVILSARVDGTLWFTAASDTVGATWGAPIQIIDVRWCLFLFRVSRYSLSF